MCVPGAASPILANLPRPCITGHALCGWGTASKLHGGRLLWGEGGEKHVRCGDSSHTKGTPMYLLKDLPLDTTVQST